MEKKKAKLVFASRLAPRKDSVEENDLGIQISSKLQPRLPVVVAAGRTGDGIDHGDWA
jgi:hypothetical protein